MQARVRADRRIALGSLCIVAAVLIVSAASSSSPEPLLARRDPAAALALVRGLKTGESVDYIADYAFTRHGARGDLRSVATDARYGAAFIARGSGTLSIDLPTKSYICIEAEGAPQCHEGNGQSSLASSEVVAVLVSLRAYDVEPAGVATVAGERVHCYLMQANKGHAVDAFGDRTTLCLAADGLVLRSRVVGAIHTDERTAQTVRRGERVDDLEPLLQGFEQVAPPVHR